MKKLIFKKVSRRQQKHKNTQDCKKFKKFEQKFKTITYGLFSSFAIH